ncbi:hypothetical protein BDN71DRAFT_1505288 [Pleurotus eryngii]|uniref:Uncharacterized protein n=1 Tax=Pleurotus eryngii TaxID=5323 RepID=A0A9P6A1H6_PLEER|nr:hypothetical protein BDN71DRAFT_1505288 [Pleurotus eryngii]
MPCHYLPEDLQSLRKPVLVALVLKQANKWLTKSFNSLKTNIPVIQAALLDPTNGFTTESPVPAGRNTNPSQDNSPVTLAAQPVAQPQTPEPLAEQTNNGMLPPTLVSLGRPSTVCTFQPSLASLQQIQMANLFLALSLVSTSSNQVHEIIKRGMPNTPYTKWLKSYQTALNLKSYLSDEEDPLSSGLPPNAKPLEIAQQRLDNQEMQWLQDCVAERPGVKQFKENCGRQMQNDNVIWQWSFAVDFLAEYYYKPCGAPGLGISASMLLFV